MQVMIVAVFEYVALNIVMTVCFRYVGGNCAAEAEKSVLIVVVTTEIRLHTVFIDSRQ